MVRLELLRDLFPDVDVRSWLCLRASGTGGGVFFCGFGTSVAARDSLGYCCAGGACCCDESCVLMCKAEGETTGVGGSGLLTSELSLGCVKGDGAGSDAVKLSNDTVCGCREVTSLPWRCLGAGGGFFLPFFTSDTRPMLSSSSDSGISKDVLGDSGCVCCGGSNNDCRDIDEVSVLLLLSNCAPLGTLLCAATCVEWLDGRSPGLPVSSRFLKLSTSSEALLLPRPGRSAAGRGSPVSLSCGSIVANVRENGLAGTPAGDTADCGA